MNDQHKINWCQKCLRICIEIKSATCFCIFTILQAYDTHEMEFTDMHARVFLFCVAKAWLYAGRIS